MLDYIHGHIDGFLNGFQWGANVQYSLAGASIVIAILLVVLAFKKR